MENYQFGFVITIALETEAVSEAEAQRWAEREANSLLKRAFSDLDPEDGVTLRTPLIVHPNHILKLEQILDRL